eukprot:m.95594 g.95594  ORF g.95594 m.95594 type:complete len:140 (-) comp16608_c0_seq1:3754-4173(-)
MLVRCSIHNQQSSTSRQRRGMGMSKKSMGMPKRSMGMSKQSMGMTMGSTSPAISMGMDSGATAAAKSMASSSAPPTAAPSDAPATVPIDFSFRKISETAGDFNVTFSEFESFGTSITSIGDFDGDDVNDIAASGTNLVY